MRQDSDNPVYYVQYAHARICSLMKKMAAEGVAFEGFDRVNAALLTDANERELIDPARDCR